MLSEEARKFRTETQREYKKKWAEKNKQHIREYMKKWRAANKDKVKANNERYWEKKYKEMVKEA